MKDGKTDFLADIEYRWRSLERLSFEARKNLKKQRRREGGGGGCMSECVYVIDKSALVDGGRWSFLEEIFFCGRGCMWGVVDVVEIHFL